MANKRRLNYDLRKLKKIRSRYLLILTVFFLALGIYGLRQNNFEMIQLRQAVVTADEQNGDVEGALKELRGFVHGHMNTDLSTGNVSIKPPIQLKYRYERLAKTESERVKLANDAVKKKGEEVCAAQHPGGGLNSARVACVAEYMRVNSVKDNGVPPELYKFDFISPTWSPDLAGMSLLFALISFSALIAKSIMELWYKNRLD
jgi:hypothetical protein